MGSTDLDTQALSRRLSGRLVGGRLLYYQVVGSSMDELRRLAEEGEREGTVVMAHEETAARGRFDRSWVSPPGENLSFSVLLRPSAAQLSFLNMAATLAVSEAVAELTGLAPVIKWPNDVMIGGRKLSGILIESDVESDEVKHAVAGIGVNVNFDPSRFPEIAATATSLYQETGRRLNRTDVLGAVLERLDDLYRAVKNGESLTDRWAAQLETLGRTVEVNWGGRVIDGEARSVDDQGNLVLAKADGSTVTVVAGEVTMQT